MENPELVLATLMQAAAPIAVKLMELEAEQVRQNNGGLFVQGDSLDPTDEDRLAINVEKAFLAVLNVYGR